LKELTFNFLESGYVPVCRRNNINVWSLQSTSFVCHSYQKQRLYLMLLFSPANSLGFIEHQSRKWAVEVPISNVPYGFFYLVLEIGMWYGSFLLVTMLVEMLRHALMWGCRNSFWPSSWSVLLEQIPHKYLRIAWEEFLCWSKNNSQNMRETSTIDEIKILFVVF
jgi:hypothetical protein